VLSHDRGPDETASGRGSSCDKTAIRMTARRTMVMVSSGSSIGMLVWYTMCRYLVFRGLMKGERDKNLTLCTWSWYKSWHSVCVVYTVAKTNISGEEGGERTVTRQSSLVSQ
jgi:hypothetical protein